MLLHSHGDRLRADFQQYYGLNVDELGEGYSVAHAAALAVWLPPESRCYRALSPDTAWSAVERLLEAIELNTHLGWWLRSEDGVRGANRPRPMLPHPEPAARRGTDMDVEEYAAYLARPRKEVTRGNGAGSGIRYDHPLDAGRHGEDKEGA